VRSSEGRREGGAEGRREGRREGGKERRCRGSRRHVSNKKNRIYRKVGRLTPFDNPRKTYSEIHEGNSGI
jgi:hypothetical protein